MGLYDAASEQTPDKVYLEKQGEDYNLVDWYLDVLRKYKDKLLSIIRYVVADAWFSKAKFVNEACLLGFYVISRLRDDAALWYSYDGVRTGKRGRPRIKGEKIDFGKLDFQHCEVLDIEGGNAYSVKAYSKAMKRNIKVVVLYPESEGPKSISPQTLTCRTKTSSNTTVHDSKLNFAFGILSSSPDSMIVRQET